MKYFSETLNKVFDSEQACLEAEKQQAEALKAAEAKKKALDDQRATRAKEVEEAYKAAVEAKKKYNQVLQEFLKDYKTFHATFKDVDPFFSFFDWF